MKNSKGFSLVELMVSLTISVVFVAAAASLMARNKTDYVPLRDSARMNEGAMAAFDVINRELEQAGFFGENVAIKDSIEKKENSNTPSTRFVNHMFDAYAAAPVQYDSIFGLKRTVVNVGGINVLRSAAVEGFEGGVPGQGFLPSGTAVFEDGTPLTTDIVPGTDAITIRGAYGGGVNILALDPNGAPIGMRGPGMLLASDAPAGSSTLNLQDVTGLPPRGYYVVFDGENSELFKGQLAGNDLSILDDTPGNNMPATAFRNTFNSLVDGSIVAEHGQAYVAAAFFTRYYIGNFTAPDGTVIPSLYREFYDPVSDTVLRNSPVGAGFDGQVLIEGVEDMQITYAENVNGDAQGAIDRYSRADQITDWANVKAVKISILVRSETPISVDATTATQTYVVNGQDFRPIDRNGQDDRFMRKVYTTQINLDNGV